MGLSDVIRYLNKIGYKCSFDDLEVTERAHILTIKGLYHKYKRLDDLDIKYITRSLSYRYRIIIKRKVFNISLWEIKIDGGYYY